MIHAKPGIRVKIWMRAVIQRVKHASVSVNDQIVSSIEDGLCVLLGIHSSDTIQDMQYITNKIVSLKLFSSDNSRWATSIMDNSSFQILVISQFTLYARSEKGSKLDFHRSMTGDDAKLLFDQTIESLRSIVNEEHEGSKIKTGIFGAKMQVNLCNDGPVTVILDSHDKKL